MNETREQDQPQMPTLRDIVFDLAQNRAHHIDRYIDRRAKHRGPDFEVSDDQFDSWTAEAVKSWRELYPTLQALWEYETATRAEVDPSNECDPVELVRDLRVSEALPKIGESR